MAHDIDFAKSDAFALNVGEAKLHKYGFLLWPQRWKKLTLPLDLQWQIFTFSEDQANNIPASPGVYAFCVEPRIIPGLNPCYLIYIGETTRTLRERFREYLREAEDLAGREKLYMALNLYKEYLYFFCAPLPDDVIPRDIETELLKAFIPPSNTKFPAEVKRIVNLVYNN